MKSEPLGVGVFPDVWWIGQTGYVSFLDYVTASVVVETWQGDAIQQRQWIASFRTGTENQYARGIGFNGQPYLVYRERWAGRVLNLVTGVDARTSLPVNGTAPFAFGAGFLAWLEANGRVVYGLELETWRDLGVLRESGEFTRPTGITRVVGRQPIFWDEDRQREPGMTCPVFAGALTVGENSSLTDPKSALGRFTGTPGRVLLWPGLDSFEPRAAEGPDGLFAVCSWGSQSVRLAIVTRADARVNDPVPGPTPKPPPPDPGHPAPPKEPPVSDRTAVVEKWKEVVERSGFPVTGSIVGAFEVSQRVAWELRGEEIGLLVKRTGENIVTWRGESYSAGRVAYKRDGRTYPIKIFTDVPATNAPKWDVGTEPVPSDQFWAEAQEPDPLGEPEDPEDPDTPPPFPDPQLLALVDMVKALAATLDALAQDVADTYDRVEALDAQIREIARRLGDVQEQQYQALDGRVPMFGGTVVLTPRRAK